MATKRKTEKPVVVEVTHTAKSGDVTSTEQEVLDNVVVPAAHATVKVGYGMTINLGSYESARVDVAVTLPCDPEKVEESYKAAEEIADKWIDEQVQKIKNPSKAGGVTKNTVGF